MGKTRAAIAVLAGSFLFCVGPSAAQSRNQSDTAEASARPLTLAERQAAWSKNKEEYQNRLLRDGQASADRWLDEQARGHATEQRPKATTPRTSQKATSKKDCKKVRWVNRATPGFGGGPMTMSRVPVCAD